MRRCNLHSLAWSGEHRREQKSFLARLPTLHAFAGLLAALLLLVILPS